MMNVDHTQLAEARVNKFFCPPLELYQDHLPKLQTQSVILKNGRVYIYLGYLFVVYAMRSLKDYLFINYYLLGNFPKSQKCITSLQYHSTHHLLGILKDIYH